MKNLLRFGQGLSLLALGWLICQFVTGWSVLELFSDKQGQLTVEQLEDRVAPRVQCKLTGYVSDQRINELSIESKSERSKEWYVPIVSEDAELPDDLSEVLFLLRLHPSRFEQFQSGTIRVSARFPESDTPLLDGSGDSALLARNVAGLNLDDIWILDVVPETAARADWWALHGVPFLVIFVVTFFAGGQLLPKMARGLVLWPSMAGLVCAAVGLPLLVFEPRLAPWFNDLRAGTGIFLCGCGIVLILRASGGYVFSIFLKANREEAETEALLAGSDDARIIILPDSVKLRQQDGSYLEVSDNQIEGVLHRHLFWTNLDTGVTESFQSVLKLRFDTGEGLQTTEIWHFFSVEQTDPLVALTDRFEINLSERWVERLDRAEQIEVQGWKLDRHALRPARGWSRSEVRIDEISDVVRDGSQLKVYCEDGRKPSLAVSREKTNAEVLERTLELLMAREPSHPEVSDHKLGGVLFEKTGELLSSLGVTVAMAALVWFQFSSGALNSPVIAGLSVFAIFAVIVAVLWSEGLGLQIREHGMVTRRWGKEQWIRWEEMESLRWSVKAAHSNGCFVGNDLSTCATARIENARRVRIRFTQRFIKDDRLDRLQDLISDAIADQMRETLYRTGRCQWTSRIAFTNAGLEVRKLPWSAVTSLMPYSELELDHTVPGKLNLRTRDDRLAGATIPWSTKNFYPGLKMLQEILDQDSTGDSVGEIRHSVTPES